MPCFHAYTCANGSQLACLQGSQESNNALQAEAMSSQMRNMSDAQMEKLLTTMSWLQSASNAVQKAKQKITENKLLCLALVILLVALLLRWLGFV